MSLSSGGDTLVMSSFGSNAYKDQKATFWKKNAKNVPGSIKPVYGAQHPPIQEMPGSGSQQGTPKKEPKRKHDSFQDFQDNTEDAWDDGDDDLILMANFKMSLKDVQRTAMQVISNHSQQSENQPPLVGEKNGELVASGAVRPGSPSQSSRSQGSGSNTPTHGPSGPGLGIRLNTQRRAAQMPKPAGHVPDRESSKVEKFRMILSSPDIDLDEIRNVSWSGIPRQYRPVAWKILSGYIPPSEDRRDLTLQRKRQEYFNFVSQYYDTRLQEIHADTFRQISIDIPRMSPLIPLFQQKLVQEIFERILYIWAIRHPASGYVQGINDLVTPFFVVFLSEFVPQDADLDNYNVSSLPKDKVDCIEADSFWCFSKLLDGIQDNYTFAQPGIQLKVNALKDIISRVDNVLHKHLEHHNVEYLQFTFRWMNNLLMREIPLRCTIRLWDSYLSEATDFASLHLYTCAALLLHFAHDLKREKDFHGLMLMLQNLPTYHWNNDEINLLLAEAYKLKFTYADAPRHLGQKKK